MASYDTGGSGASSDTFRYDTGRRSEEHSGYDTGRKSAGTRDPYDTGSGPERNSDYDTGRPAAQQDSYDTGKTYLDAGRNVAKSPSAYPGYMDTLARTTSGSEFSYGYSQIRRTFHAASSGLNIAGALMGGAVAQNYARSNGYAPDTFSSSKGAADYLRNRTQQLGDKLAESNIYVSHVSTDTIRIASFSGPVTGLLASPAGFLIAGRTLTKEEKDLTKEMARTQRHYRMAMNSSLAGSRLVSGNISAAYHLATDGTDYAAGSAQAVTLIKTGATIGKVGYYTATRSVDAVWALSAIYNTGKAARYTRKAARASGDAAAAYRGISDAARKKAGKRINSFLKHRENQGMREARFRNLTDPGHIVRKTVRLPVKLAKTTGKAAIGVGKWTAKTRPAKWAGGTRPGKAVKKAARGIWNFSNRFIITPVKTVNTVRKKAGEAVSKVLGLFFRPLFVFGNIISFIKRLPFYLFIGCLVILMAMSGIQSLWDSVVSTAALYPQAAYVSALDAAKGLLSWLDGEDEGISEDSLMQKAVDLLWERQMDYGTQAMEGSHGPESWFSDLEKLNLYKATLNDKPIAGKDAGKIQKGANGYTATLPVKGNGTITVQEEVNAEARKKLLTRPAKKELPESYKTGKKIVVTYVLNNGASKVTQNLYQGAAGTEYAQYLGENCSLEKDTSYVNGWRFIQSDSNYASIDFKPYEYVSESVFNKLLDSARQSGNNYNITLYAHWKDKVYVDKEHKVTSTKDYEVGVDSDENTQQYLGIDSMNVQYAFTDESGELQYTDNDGDVNTFSSTTLYKAIVIMATVATQNDVNVKNVDKAYYEYCEKLFDKAISSGAGYEVNYHSQVLEGTADKGEGYTWEENGITYTADKVVLTADITIYVGCYLEDLMDADNSDAESMQKLGFTGSTFEGWTQQNRDLAWEYMKLDDETFQELFNVSFPYGFMMPGNVWAYIEEAMRMAADPHIGYSQTTRCLNPNVDCSSFVYYSLKKAGFDMGRSTPFSTSDMGPVLQNLGFEKYPIGSVKTLMEGDILWWDGTGNRGHTEIYIGNGQMVGAHGQYNRAFADQVSVCGYSQGSFTHIFRLPATGNYDWVVDKKQPLIVQAIQSSAYYYNARLQEFNNRGGKMQYSNHGWANNYFRRFDQLLSSKDKNPRGRPYYSANCDSGHWWIRQDLHSPDSGMYSVSDIWYNVTSQVTNNGKLTFRQCFDRGLIRPGDLIDFVGHHRFIYVGNGMVFDTGHGCEWKSDTSILHTDDRKAVFKKFIIPMKQSPDYTRTGKYKVLRAKPNFAPRYYRSQNGVLVPFSRIVNE